MIRNNLIEYPIPDFRPSPFLRPFRALKPALLALALSSALAAAGQPSLPLAVVNTRDTKLRACSGLDCPVLGLLWEGQRCEILRTERLEEIGGYGVNTWAEVTVNGRRGFVYGALLSLLPDERGLVPLQETALVTEGRANVRACPDRNCEILFQLPASAFCRVAFRTSSQMQLPGQDGVHPWYFIDYQGKTGFIHGSILVFNDNSGNRLTIKAEKAEAFNEYKEPRALIAMAYKGQSFQVLRQSDASELIRPYGRHYWYLVALGPGQLGWVFGAFTSKAGEPVDCQCVDYIKHRLDISGPTRNAFEWGEVLQGHVQVAIGGVPGFLRYREVFPPEQVMPGDLAVFDRSHPEVHPDYGHIGFVNQAVTGPDGYLRQVEIEGGNHQVPIENYYSDSRCNNVSLKWYAVNQHVRFFRLN